MADPFFETAANYENGYSEKFDLDQFEGRPRISYLVATTPRSGSTWLSHLLWSTGGLGAPLEYLNFRPQSHYAVDVDDRAAQLSHWIEVQRRRTTPNGVFGHKVFLPMLASLKTHNPDLLAQMRPNYIVHLSRRDRVAQASSYARAAQTGAWVAGPADHARPAIPAELVRDALASIAAQEEMWEALFKSMDREPLRLVYEDVVADPGKAVAEVASFLGVTLDTSVRLNVPPVLRQARDGRLRPPGARNPQSSHEAP
jgi:LPS sulfotransferase NodH